LNRFLPPTSHDETPSSADIPKTDIDIPNTVIDIPKTDIDIPNTVIDIPKTDIDIPKRESLARANLEFKQETTPETTPKEHTPPSPSAGERARDSPRHKHRTPRQKGYSEPFCTFYDAYLRHEDPDDAWKAWQSIDGDAHAEAIMAGVAAHYQANDAWKRREMRYVKKPAAWLRAGSYKSDFARSIKDEEEGRTRRLQLYKAIEEGQPL
jgi:hypothetical protein